MGEADVGGVGGGGEGGAIVLEVHEQLETEGGRLGVDVLDGDGRGDDGMHFLGENDVAGDDVVLSCGNLGEGLAGDQELEVVERFVAHCGGHTHVNKGGKRMSEQRGANAIANKRGQTHV